MRRRRKENGFIAPVILILSCVYFSPALAANLIVKPSISLNEQWDSNIFNSSDNTISDFVFRASPRLTLSLETYQATLNLNGGFVLERYSEHDELDSATATKNFDLSADKPLQITPQFSLQPSARFVETEDSVQRNLLTEDPIPELPPSETIVTVRAKAREYSAALNMIYLLTPNTTLEIGGGGTKREYTEEVVGLFGSRSLTGNARIRYRITPRFSSGISFGTSYYTSDNNSSSRTYYPELIATYALSDIYSIEGRVGATYLKEPGEGGGPDTHEWSPRGQLSVRYAWKDFNATLLGSYAIAGIGSFGVITERGNIRLTLTDRFAQWWWWDLSGSYQVNLSTDDPRTVNVSTVTGSAGIRYQAAEWAIFRLAGNTVHQQTHDSIAGTNLDRNSVYLGVDLRKDYRLF